MPVSGFTHFAQTAGISWSAYRFHDRDPLLFANGFRYGPFPLFISRALDVYPPRTRGWVALHSADLPNSLLWRRPCSSLEWRNGDMVDKVTGLKCYTLSGGNPVGSPTASSIVSYSWVYVWD